MANVYYKIDGSNCYYSNEFKGGYKYWSNPGSITGSPSYNRNIIIELYNNKFILPGSCRLLFAGITNTTFNDMDKWDSSEVTVMMDMFRSSSALTSLDLSSWDTARVWDTRSMFYGCSNLKTIYASDKFVTTLLDSDHSSNMFSNCRALVGGEGTLYNISYLDKTYARIDEGISRPGYFTYKIPGASAYIKLTDSEWTDSTVYIKTENGWKESEVLYL